MSWKAIVKSIQKKIEPKNVESIHSVTEEPSFIFASTRSGSYPKLYSCSNCKNIVDQRQALQSTNGKVYCSISCEEQGVIQEVNDVNKRHNLTEEESYFE